MKSAYIQFCVWLRVKDADSSTLNLFTWYVLSVCYRESRVRLSVTKVVW